eukprot:jgi/Picsp_1/4787/NSC_02155-R1_autophagy protein 5
MEERGVAEMKKSACSKLVWETRLPIRVRLSDEDLACPEKAPDLYLTVSRQQYLYSLMEKIIPFWRHVIPPSGSRTPWLEYGSLPLKWDIPAGALFDLLVPKEGKKGQHLWELTAHFSKYPLNTLPMFHGTESLRGCLFNSMKESSFIRHASAARVMNMVSGARETMWKSLQEVDWDTFQQASESLHMGDYTSRSSGDEDRMRVPVRLLFRDVSSKKAFMSSYDNVYYSSRSFPDVSVRKALLPVVKAWIVAESDDNRSRTKLNVTATQEDNDNDDQLWGQLQVYLAGAHLQQPGDGLLLVHTLWNEFRSPDGFLYIIVLLQDSTLYFLE